MAAVHTHIHTHRGREREREREISHPLLTCWYLGGVLYNSCTSSIWNKSINWFESLSRSKIYLADRIGVVVVEFVLGSL